MMFVGNLSDVRCTAAALAPGYGLAVALSLALTAAPAQGGSITHVEGFTFHGDSAGDDFGFSVSGAGDVNGDGTPDLIVGAIGDVDGSARVFSGLNGSEIHTFYGDNPFGNFGSSVSGVGDVNNDGFDDLIVGDPPVDVLPSGSARLISGKSGDTLHTFVDARKNSFGSSVSGVGDVNGDGTPDLIVGDISANNNVGSATVFSGNTDTGNELLFTVNGDDAGGQFGSSVSGAGYVNDDNIPDFIVGAWNDETVNGPSSGSARVYSGADGTKLFTFNGENENDFFGSSVSGAGDVNGDGTPDLIVGAWNDRTDNGPNSGSARVLSGADGTELFTFNGDNLLDVLGSSVSGAGDVNDDGFDDLIVGAPEIFRLDEDKGYARVFSGKDGSELFTFHGDDLDDQFGTSVSGLDDINGDGIADFVVGARNGGLNGGGYARVFLSQTVIPEPTAAALIALGGTLLLRRRIRLAE